MPTLAHSLNIHILGLGYPGHHVYNSLLEERLYRKHGHVEYCIYPLFSPQSLIAEGSANYGIDMVFPTVTDRVAYESTVLFPLAGLDPATAADYCRVEGMVRVPGATTSPMQGLTMHRGGGRGRRQVHRLSYAGNEAARRYLDGAIDRAAAEHWLVRYALMAPERARQRIAFFDKYRSVSHGRVRPRTPAICDLPSRSTHAHTRAP